MSLRRSISKSMTTNTTTESMISITELTKKKNEVTNIKPKRVKQETQRLTS